MQVGLIMVRWNSSRLPGKALMPIAGKPLLQRTYETLRLAGLDEVIVSTTVNSQPIVDFCLEHRWPLRVYQGDENDLLGRMCAAVEKDDVVVRVWGDNPFPYPWLITQTLQTFYLSHTGYVVGHSGDSYCSAVNANTLYDLDKIVKDMKDREDIHTWMVDHLPSCVINYPGLPLKLTVDTKEDLDRINALFS